MQREGEGDEVSKASACSEEEGREKKERGDESSLMRVEGWQDKAENEEDPQGGGEKSAGNEGNFTRREKSFEGREEDKVGVDRLDEPAEDLFMEEKGGNAAAKKGERHFNKGGAQGV